MIILNFIKWEFFLSWCFNFWFKERSFCLLRKWNHLRDHVTVRFVRLDFVHIGTKNAHCYWAPGKVILSHRSRAEVLYRDRCQGQFQKLQAPKVPNQQLQEWSDDLLWFLKICICNPETKKVKINSVITNIYYILKNTLKTNGSVITPSIMVQKKQFFNSPTKIHNFMQNFLKLISHVQDILLKVL